MAKIQACNSILCGSAPPGGLSDAMIEEMHTCMRNTQAEGRSFLINRLNLLPPVSQAAHQLDQAAIHISQLDQL